uniref:Uncharacterized protein AlNc14C179G8193 n=1 Tax=Albugo laibachii Nc14 TaxID=890382 RepID=F0WEM5_9STRA|nr:conserved hypothetical protein [Albugo laibachii Nc14]CCA23089.1 conserved hypothetical protein [Albugo laibachii Nc14]|eukprot:CCA23089.1 conserved hypothetical protein [Albugo laibachii Nc14]
MIVSGNVSNHQWNRFPSDSQNSISNRYEVAALRRRELHTCSRLKQSCARTKRKKSVRWDKITVHEFGVGLGGSTVSNRGGPSIGLSEKPEFTWYTKVGEMAECSEGIHRFTPEERVFLLKTAGIDDEIILRYSREASIILGSRQRTMAETMRKHQRQRHNKRNLDTLDQTCSTFAQKRPALIPANYDLAIILSG